MSASTEKKNRIAAREAGTDKKTLAAQEEAKKKAQSKRRWTWGAIGVAVLIVLIIAITAIALKKGFSIAKGDTKLSVGGDDKKEE